MGTNYNPQIVTSGLTLAIDAANPKCYSYAENLIAFSQAINSGNGWSIGPNTTFISSANTAPDGTLTATSAFGNGSGGNIFIARAINYAANTWYTASCWARLSNGSVPSNGTILSISYAINVTGTQTRSTVIYNGNLTSNWQRFSTSFFNVAAGTYTAFFVADQTNTSTIEIWGAQIERGNTLNRYVATTSNPVIAPAQCNDLVSVTNKGTLLNNVYFQTANNGTFVLNRINNSYITNSATVGSVGMYQNNFTVSSWFNTPNTAPTSATQGGAVIGADGNAGPGGQYANLIRFDTFRVNYYAEDQSISILPNTWYNMVHTYNYTTKVSRVYVNGILSNTLTRTIDLNANTINSIIKIGNYGFGGDTFTGSIPQVLIYNRELSADEVSQNFNATRGRFGV